MPSRATPDDAAGAAARAVFQTLWGTTWRTKAAAMLGMYPESLSAIAMGKRALSKRHVRILETYAMQKAAVRKQGIARAVAKAEREAKAEYDAIATVRQTLKAMAAQDARQSTHKQKRRT